jgi:hypothetical protein
MVCRDWERVRLLAAFYLFTLLASVVVALQTASMFSAPFQKPISRICRQFPLEGKQADRARDVLGGESHNYQVKMELGRYARGICPAASDVVVSFPPRTETFGTHVDRRRCEP